MLIVQANNIHEGGSKALLVSFIKTIIENPNNQLMIILFLDSRSDLDQALDLKNNKRIIIKRVAPRLITRLLSELEISLLSYRSRDAKVFSFGNIPPLFPVFGKSILFFQTVLYFKDFSRFISSPKVRFKIAIERNWLNLRIKSVDSIFVQSNAVKEQLVIEHKVDSKKIHIKPFTDLEELKVNDQEDTTEKDGGFFYPAIGTSHKNHLNLIKAWVLLAQEGIYPVLIVTLDSRYQATLDQLVVASKQYNVKFKNIGHVSRSEVLKQMVKSDALIFPSLCESFGLPLLEARENNVAILAGELDFVRDLVVPKETFNPTSALSIARAVKRFLKIEEKPVVIQTSGTFVDLVLKD